MRGSQAVWCLGTFSYHPYIILHFGFDYENETQFYVLVVFYCPSARLPMLHGQGIITERKFENYTLITKIYDTLSLEVLLCKGFLQEAGYEVAVANDGVEALSLFAGQRYDLIVLDIMLPKIDGYGVCELIRKQSDVPIIMLTALSGEEDQIKGLDLQVDDYITKPFSMPVLLRKIAAVLRRSNRETDEKYQIITYGNLLLNCDSYTATVDGVTYELTQKEFEILRELLTHQGRILTRQNLLDKLWRYDFYGDERVVDTHIKNLRKKLGIDFIQTIRGVGYKVDKEN